MKIFVSGKLFEFEEATVKWRPEHVLAKLCKKQLEQKQDVSAYPNAVDITLPNRPSNDLGLIRSPDAEIEASTAATRSEHITVHGRSTDAFKAIMTYYQTGRLHIPLCMCIGAFKDEMDYWGISTSELTECCLYK
ncbi:hypothetical protein DPMN_157830 [Dreissena polymorpha]|uniref:Potassium channel tetramerisation-type BTB domain-containing protein n=1 Tax=Dreissena polymorpha TaxID=45954 RepID=A0A9D4ILE5_DREPO|nr:hypothetical protein DPMN_157830 [Dreissena polymorpha]